MKIGANGFNDTINPVNEEEIKLVCRVFQYMKNNRRLADFKKTSLDYQKIITEAFSQSVSNGAIIKAALECGLKCDRQGENASFYFLEYDFKKALNQALLD